MYLGVVLNKKYHVHLTAAERELLESLIRTGAAPARTQTHARILLKADGGDHGSAWPDDAIVRACDVSRPTVERVRRAFATHGLETALHRKRPVRAPQRKLDGAQEAQLVAIACSPPPQGEQRWTLALLRDKLVELEVVDRIARETVRTTLKKTNSSPG